MASPSDPSRDQAERYLAQAAADPGALTAGRAISGTSYRGSGNFGGWSRGGGAAYAFAGVRRQPRGAAAPRHPIQAPPLRRPFAGAASAVPAVAPIRVPYAAAAEPASAVAVEPRPHPPHSITARFDNGGSRFGGGGARFSGAAGPSCATAFPWRRRWSPDSAS
ncbi:unnamed protein product [Urochloa humidicola]